jgi:phospholipid-transporting ATPase
MNPELSKELMAVADLCGAVICCRVSPAQKAQVVQMVRKALPNVMTLGIGDGANDVNMICAAHVGIGISGLEGQQAVRASDFAVAQFSFLQRLLFVHGRECYRRNSTLVCYNFYKNILVTMPLFWYGFLSVFSGQLFYNTWIFQLFNLCFTALPIMLYALFDYETTHDQLMLQPKFYGIGLNHKHFNPKVFWSWIFEAAVHSLCILVGVMVGLNLVSCDAAYGRMNTLAGSGIIVFGTIVLFANIKIFMISYVHFWFSIVVMVLSTASYYASEMSLTKLFPIMPWLDNFENHGMTMITLNDPVFYMVTLLLVVGCNLPQPLYREYRTYARNKRLAVAVQPYKIVVDDQSDEEELLPRDQPAPHNRFSLNVAFTAKKRKD